MPDYELPIDPRPIPKHRNLIPVHGILKDYDAQLARYVIVSQPLPWYRRLLRWLRRVK